MLGSIPRPIAACCSWAWLSLLTSRTWSSSSRCPHRSGTQSRTPPPISKPTPPRHAAAGSPQPARPSHSPSGAPPRTATPSSATSTRSAGPPTGPTSHHPPAQQRHPHHHQHRIHPGRKLENHHFPPYRALYRRNTGGSTFLPSRPGILSARRSSPRPLFPIAFNLNPRCVLCIAIHSVADHASQNFATFFITTPKKLRTLSSPGKDPQETTPSRYMRRECLSRGT